MEPEISEKHKVAPNDFPRPVPSLPPSDGTTSRDSGLEWSPLTQGKHDFRYTVEVLAFYK